MNIRSVPPPVFRIIVLVSVAVALLVGVAFVAPDGRLADAQVVRVDYDLDNDRLIDVRTRAQFQAIHYDLNGDGVPESRGHWPGNAFIRPYATAYPNPVAGMGCPLGDHDDSATTPDQPYCIGYELLNDISHDGGQSVALGKVNDRWAGHTFTAQLVGNGFRVINFVSSENNGGYMGLVSVVGKQASIEGIGVLGARYYPIQEMAGPLAGLLRGKVIGSYAQGGHMEWATGNNQNDPLHGGAGGIVGQVRTGNDFAGLIAHSYSRDVIVGRCCGHNQASTYIAGIARTFQDETNGNQARCLNSYFSGVLRLATNAASNTYGTLAVHLGSGTQWDNCYSDMTRDNTPSNVWARSNAEQNAAYHRPASDLKVTEYEGALAPWNDYDAAGNLLDDTAPRMDFWYLGDETMLPVHKGWGHDRTLAPARGQSGASTVDLCTRTPAVANEIIRLLKDDTRVSGVATTPAAVTALTGCTGSNTQSVSITNLSNLVVTTPDNMFNLRPSRSFPASEKLTSLHQDDFAYLVNAQHFDLGDNLIEELKPRIFEGVPVRYLDLSNNRLTSLPADLFVGVRTQTSVSGSNVNIPTSGNSLLLNGNSLTYTGLPGRIFDPLAWLNGIDLSDNSLTRVNTRWFAELENLGYKPAATPPYTHALGVHLGGNTITEHYYTEKLYSGVRENITLYSGANAGDDLRDAIEAAITAKAGGTTPTTLDLESTSVWANAGGATTGYQASTVTTCYSTQTEVPGRGDFLIGVVPDCIEQPHFTAPQKAGDAAPTAPALTALTGSTVDSEGKLNVRFAHMPTTAWVTYQLRYRTSTDDYWSPWQSAPIMDIAGGKDFVISTPDYGAQHDVQLRVLHANAPPSAPMSVSYTPDAANWFTGLSATPTSIAVTLSWNAISSSTPTTGHSVVAFYYRYKRSADPVYGAWHLVPDGSDAMTSLADETGYTVTGLIAATQYNVQMAAAIDGTDADSDAEYLTDRMTVTTTTSSGVTLSPTAAGGTTPGSILVSWTMQTAVTNSTTKFQVRRKRKTASWRDVAWIDVPDDSVTTDTDAHTHDEDEYLFSNLPNDTEYDIQLRLWRSDALGAEAPINMSATSTEVAAPVGFSAAEGTNPGTVALSWNMQSATTTANAYYQVRWKESSEPGWPANGGWISPSGLGHNATSYTITNLQDDINLEFGFRFVWDNTIGASDPVSDTSDVKDVADIAGFGAVASRGQVVLSWTAQTASTHSQAGYQYRYKLDSAEWPETQTMGWNAVTGGHGATTVTITDLPGALHDFQVRFRYNNTVGFSDVESAQATPTSPATPTNFSAANGTNLGDVDLSWMAQTTSSDATSHYEYRTRVSGEDWSSWADLTGSGPTTATHTLTNQRISVSTEFQLRFYWTGPSAAASATLTTAGINAPQNPSHAVRAGEVYLSWDAQTDTTNAQAGYEVRYKKTSVANWPTESPFGWEEATGTAHDSTSYSVTGLETGALYNIQLRFKYNDTLGASPSVSFTTVAMIGLPTPGSVTAATGDLIGEVDFTWDSQSATTSADAKFQIRDRVSAEGETPAGDWSAWADVADSTSDSVDNAYAEVGDTMTYTSYQSRDFEVRLALGDSASASVTRSNVRAGYYPRNFRAAAGSVPGTIVGTWDRWENVYQNNINRVALQRLPAGTLPVNVEWGGTDIYGTNVCCHMPPDDGMRHLATSVTLTGLKAGELYDVRADFNNGPPDQWVNSWRGPVPHVFNVQAAPVPVPTGFSAVASTSASGALDLEWDQQTSLTATTIKYQVRAKLRTVADWHGIDWVDVPDSSADSTSNAYLEEEYTLTGLTGGEAHDVQVRMFYSNAIGLSEPADTTGSASSVDAPGSFSVSAGTLPGNLVLSWAVVTGAQRYEYRYKRSSDAEYPNTWTEVPDQDAVPDGQGDETTVTVTGLDGGVGYDLQLRTVIPSGSFSSATELLAQQTPQQASPASLTLSQGTNAGDLTLTWTAPPSGTAIRYEYRYKLASGTQWSSYGALAPTASPFTLTSLHAGVSYDVGIRVVTADGTSGDRTASGTTQTLAGPTGFSATRGTTGGAIALSWSVLTAGLPTGDSVVRYEYRRQLTTGGSWGNWTPIPDSDDPMNSPGDETAYTITGLASYTEYDVELRAAIDGDDDPSTTVAHYFSTSGTPAQSGIRSGINAVDGLSASAGTNPGDVNLSWDPQTEFPMGTAVTYTYRHKLASANAWPGTWTTIPGTAHNLAAHTVSNLMSGQPYDFQLRYNAGGALTSGAATAQGTARAIAVPTLTAATSTSAAGAIDLSWPMQTAVTGSDAEFQYRVKVAGQADPTPTWPWRTVPDNGDQTADPDTDKHDESSYTVTELESGTRLTAGTRYHVELRFYASTAIGASAASSASQTASSVPTPGNFQATPGSSALTVDLTWNAVAGATFEYKCDPAGTGCDTTWKAAGSGTSFTVTGLTANETYSFVMRAQVANVGTSPDTPTRTSLPQAQSPPNMFSATTGSDPGEINLSWTAPTSPAGTVTGFEHRYRRASQPDVATSWTDWTDVPDSDSTPAVNPRSNETSYTLTSLWAGVSYVVQIRTESSQGESLAGASTTQTATAKEVAAPTTFTASIGNTPGTISLTWDAIMSTGLPTNDTLVQYQFQTRLSTATQWPTAWTNMPVSNTAAYTITGLVPATQYDVQVRAAIDDNGDADSLADYFSEIASASNVYAGIDAPANLRSTTPTSGDPGRLTVSWNAQTTFGSTYSAAKYEFRYRLTGSGAYPSTGAGSWADVPSSGHDTHTHTLSNILSGKQFDVQIRFYVNSAIGYSAPTQVTGRTRAIDVPLGFTATTSSTTAGAIDLSWTPQSAITVGTAKYQYRTKPTADTWSSQAWQPIDDSTADVDSHHYNERAFTITGLSAGDRYDIQLRFFMSTAIGGSDPASASATASRVPVPRMFRASPGSNAGEVALSWLAVTGATGYEYRYKLRSAANYAETGAGSWTTTGSTAVTYTVTGLTGGTWYSLELRALVSGIGASAAASEQDSRAQTTAAPTNVMASGGTAPGSITLTWGAPSSGTVTRYEYRYKLDTASDSAYPATFTQVPDSNGNSDLSDETTVTITGLTNRVLYDVELRVFVGADGYSLPQEVTATATAVPAPTSFSADEGTNAGEVDLRWTAPSGVTVLRYEVRHRAGTTGTWSGWTSAGTTPGHTYSGLLAGTARTFQLRTVMTDVGFSESVEATGTPKPVPPPASFTLSTGTYPGEINLSWPAVVGATSYEYRYRPDGSTDAWPAWVSVSAPSTTAAVTLLDEGVTYDFELRAVVANVGVSSEIMGSETARTGVFPEVDESTRPALNTNEFALSVAAFPGRIAIVHEASQGPYIYRFRTANPGLWSRWYKVEPDRDDTQYLIPGLEPGTRYDIQIRAYRAATQEFTMAFDDDEAAAPLKPVDDFMVGDSAGVILLTWTSPSAFTPNAYEYRARRAGSSQWSLWESVLHQGERGSMQRAYVTTLEFQAGEPVAVDSGVDYTFELRMATQAGPSPKATATGASLLRVPEVERIAPEVREVTVRAGEQIALTVSLYDAQGMFDNGIAGREGKQLEIMWVETDRTGDTDAPASHGGSFADAGHKRRTLYTAPESPGVYYVTGEAEPLGVCIDDHERRGQSADEDRTACRAVFTIRVTAAPTTAVPRPDPVNPAGTIPTSWTDNAGAEYAVFTPADGGTFTANGVTITAPAGAVADQTLLGVTASVSAVPTPPPVPGASMTVAGTYYDVAATTREGEAPLLSYKLQEPATVCLPFPNEFRADLSNVVAVERKADGNLSLLSTRIRVTAGEFAVCGALSTLPATIGTARLGTVPAPTQVPDGTGAGIETPDTGATAPGWIALAMMLILGAILVTARLTGMHRIHRM